MSALRTRNRWTSWIAAWAILLASLAPSLAQGLGWEKSMPWIEVCTTQGSKWIQGDRGDLGALPGAKHLLEHCPFCLLHAPAMGMPPSASPIPLVSGLEDEFPRAFLAAPRTLHAWVSAQARAPPSAL
ncbi:MAG TPA: DUF2946 domain-containing protein [Burkholderiaceae bacterium]|nr:DUF2946 domain-containing protein [Burkholderiaceae bacterium]